MSEPQPFTDDELAQARDAPLGWTARRWLATVDALRAALAARPQPLFEGTVGDWAVLDGDERYLGIQGRNLGDYDNPNCWPDRIVVYPTGNPS